MYLAPHDLAGYGTVCAKASPGCKQACLYSAGRGSFSTVQNARIRKTKLFFEDNKLFVEHLTSDLNLFNQYCLDNKTQGYVRLNGTSDIDWQKIKSNKTPLFDLYKNLQFYDYTKDFKRKSSFNNYQLTYSKSEETSLTAIQGIVRAANNVAVVFDKLPQTWQGMEVVNGDLSDLRPLDKRGVIVGLVAKGSAKKDVSGFVVNTAIIKTIKI